MTGYLRWVAPKCGPCVQGQDTMVPHGRQNTAHPGFVGKAARYDCGRCIAWHVDQHGFPALQPSDVEAWNLWFLVHDQQRAGGMGELLGLDYGVLPAVFRLERIPRARWPRLFRSLVALNQVVQRQRAQDAAAQRQKAQTRAQPPRVGG